jgi:hypothetical protein
MISSTVWKRKLLWDICNAVLVFLLPFAIYLHLFFDNENTDIKIIGYYYEHGYSGTRTFVWMILLKLIPLLLLIIWFINTHKWWRYFLFLLMILWIDSLLRNTFFYPQIIENNEVILSIAINCLILTFVFLGDNILFRDIRQIKISLPLRKIILNNDKKLLLTIEKI